MNSAWVPLFNSLINSQVCVAGYMQGFCMHRPGEECMATHGTIGLHKVVKLVCACSYIIGFRFCILTQN